MNNANNVEIINTHLDISADAILEASKGKISTDGIVIGWDENDNLYCAITTESKAENLLLLERAKQWIMG